jgi:hypothetical protein
LRAAEQAAFDESVAPADAAAVGTKEPVVAEPEPKVDEPEIKPADPWEGVPPVVRERLDAISSQLGVLDKLGNQASATVGRIAAIQSKLDAANKAAEQVENAPSKAQIGSATASGQKWETLKTDFPEWAEAMEEKLAAERAGFKPPTVDIEGIHKGVDDKVHTATVQHMSEIVGMKHPEWEGTIATPQFGAWYKTQPPEIQKLGESIRARDAIRVLDLYTEHQKAEADRLKKQHRLESAIPVRGIAPSGNQSQTERAAAEAEFAKVFSG